MIQVIHKVADILTYLFSHLWFSGSFQIPFSIGRRLGTLGKGSWVTMMAILTLLCGGAYVYQVNLGATKSYQLRNLETQRDRLLETVSSLETKIAEMRSMKTMQERIQGLGYIPIEAPQFLDTARNAYALAK